MSVAPCFRALGIPALTSLLLGCLSPAPPGTAEPGATPPSGSAVEAPVFSADPCEKDADCAPVAECHADRCVQVANAGSMPPETMCTMECRPRTVDCGYNHCGCASSPSGKKVCALLPGTGKP